MIIACNMYLICTRVSSKIAIYIFQENKLRTQSYHNLRGKISFDIEEIKSSKEKCLSLMFLFSSKNSPPFTETKLFLCLSSSRFNVLCMCYLSCLMLLEFLKKIMHCAILYCFVREFERDKVDYPETSFFLSIILHAICACSD